MGLLSLGYLKPIIIGLLYLEWDDGKCVFKEAECHPVLQLGITKACNQFSASCISCSSSLSLEWRSVLFPLFPLWVPSVLSLLCKLFVLDLCNSLMVLHCCCRSEKELKNGEILSWWNIWWNYMKTKALLYMFALIENLPTEYVVLSIKICGIFHVTDLLWILLNSLEVKMMMQDETTGTWNSGRPYHFLSVTHPPRALHTSRTSIEQPLQLIKHFSTLWHYVYWKSCASCWPNCLLLECIYR